MTRPPNSRGSIPAPPLEQGADWRGIAQCWAGPLITLGVVLIFIFGIGRHWHG
jgi:hypothetical protein